MTDTINYSVREFRHIANRLLHARGAQRHMVNGVRDVLLFAQAAGFDAFTELERTQHAVHSFDGRLLTTAAGEYSASGQAAYYVAPTLVDLLVVSAHREPSRVTLTEVETPTIFAALAEYAMVRGVAIDVVGAARDRVELEFHAIAHQTATEAVEHPLDAEGPAMRRALIEGFHADTAQFWRLFHASDQALTPDSELSRRHAGSQIYDADGNLVGESDEESYDYIRSFADEMAS
jgi:hypothetical protein